MDSIPDDLITNGPTFHRFKWPDGKTIYLKDMSTVQIMGVECIAGDEVDTEGSPTNRRRLVQASLLTAPPLRAYVSRKYGELVVPRVSKKSS